MFAGVHQEEMRGRFIDRKQGGRALAQRLKSYATQKDLLVLGLPRGGVPVAYEIAEALNAPLDVFVVRKLGLPGQPELAMGAIASGGVRVLNRDVIAASSVSSELIDLVTQQELAELKRRELLYRGDRTPYSPTDRCVILVDDGLATGATMRAAIAAVRKYRPSKIIVAVPVAAPQTCKAIEESVDELLCIKRPDQFHAVGLWYENFEPTPDGEIQELLRRSRSR